MKYAINILAIVALTLGLSAFELQKPQTYRLTVKVSDIRNSEGVIQLTLYNKAGSIPDKEFKKYFKLTKGKILKGRAVATFTDLPSGKYAVNILHDENSNG